MPPSAITGTPGRAPSRAAPGPPLDRRELRHADAGDDARGADRARADADLDRRRRRPRPGRAPPRRWRRCRRRRRRESRRLSSRTVSITLRRVPVGGVDDQDVDAGLDQPLGALVVVDADRRPDAQPPARVAQPSWGTPRACFRSFIVIRPARRMRSSTIRSFSTLCWCRQLARVVERRARRGGDQVLAGHHLRHGRRRSRVWKRQSRRVRIPTTVSPSTIGRPEMLLLRHDLARLAERRARRQRHRVEDHAVGRALDLVDLADLLLDREVAVDDADAALARQRHGEGHLGDRVHGGRDERDVERDVAREARRDVDRRAGTTSERQRDQQDVVERQSEGQVGGHRGALPRQAQARGPRGPLDAARSAGTPRGRIPAPRRGPTPQPSWRAGSSWWGW